VTGPKRDPWARERAELEARLRPGEREHARGRTHWLEPPRLLGGSTYDFLLVTDRRLLWSGWGGPIHELTLDAVRSAADGTYLHRYTLVLTHDPVERTEWAPAHRLLWFRWGNTTEKRLRRTTTFAFSRRDTEAAAALRDRLEPRGIAIGSLEMPEAPPRDDGSAMLTLSDPKIRRRFRG